jgi:type IV pilus assembly protein PilE
MENAMKMQEQKGFTLVELLITVVIVGMLASIAYPSYTEYVTRGRIPEATAGLANWRAKMTQFYLDTRAYDGSNGGTQPAIPTAQYFDFSLTLMSPTTYKLVATGKGVMAGFNYTIDQANGRTSNTPWGNSTTCWVTKRGGTTC